MLYIEPTPYVLDLILQLKKVVHYEIDVVFIKENFSQQWNLENSHLNYDVLPNGFKSGFALVKHKLKTNQYDLIHLAGWGDRILISVILYAGMMNIPMAIESDTPLSDNSLIKRTIKYLILSSIFRFPSIFLPGGSKQAELFRHYGVPESKIKIAQMTVDIDKIKHYIENLSASDIREARDKYNFSNENNVFLYVGRLEPHKGISELIDAYKMLYKQNKKVKLLIVGDGSMAVYIKQSINDCPGISYAGRLQGDDLFNAYAIADVFVLPSLFEPWGLVINEAMSAGLPVIVSDKVGCIVDLVENKGSGIIVNMEKNDDLLNAMKSLQEDKSLQKNMAECAQQTIKSWTKENEAENVLSAWNKVI